jgi:hypothetical protein
MVSTATTVAGHAAPGIESRILERIISELQIGGSVLHPAGYGKSEGKNYGSYGKDAIAEFDILVNPATRATSIRIRKR